MAKVLFVNASDRPVEAGISVKMYHAFLQSYKESNPSDDITELNLLKKTCLTMVMMQSMVLLKRTKGWN